MAVIATERWTDRRLRKSSDGWTAERGFDVVGAAHERQAMEASGIPTIDSPHPLNGTLKCSDVAVVESHLTLYRIKALYKPSDPDSQGNEEDPLAQAPTIEWRTGNTTEQVDRDISNNPITNSARESQDGGWPKFVTTLHLTVTRNMPFFDVQHALQYTNKTNSDTFTVQGVGTVAPGQAFCQTISPAGTYVASVPFVAVRHEFEFRRDGFELRFVDKGYQGFYAGSGGDTLGDIVTSNGEKLTQPALLNGLGKPIDPTLKIKNGNLFTPLQIGTPAGATAVPLSGGTTAAGAALKWTVYESVPFAGLI